MIRAVFFDAVGTLIEPHPSAVDVYHLVGQHHGSRLGRDEIGRRFRAAFRNEDDLDREQGWRTDEAREEERWRRIVATVLDDVEDGASCFRALWDHFANPASWRCLEGAESVLTELERRGYLLGMASNFDRRLHRIVEAFPTLKLLRHVIVSSEVGWRKPACDYFDALIDISGVEASHILFVGDDPENDDVGARNAGMQSLLLGSPQGRLTSLVDLLNIVDIR